MHSLETGSLNSSFGELTAHCSSFDGQPFGLTLNVDAHKPDALPMYQIWLAVVTKDPITLQAVACGIISGLASQQFSVEGLCP
jgi:hypothetical protein